ncbi:hypothetical protein CO157_03350 [Candidatus Peregrinibacteria bacterium CG_4_9_14_3_um_filter_49_12]|nr:MAG: hypothetical protein CO157_03350 [Candidatus Peregrinibacteria bacterium CG_4_9_14_3_um_filter_49_12]
MPLRFHIMLALGAFIALFGIATQTIEHSPRLKTALRNGAVDIGIEHSMPLSIDMEYSVHNSAGMMRIGSNATEIISISVPEEWKRGEVSGASLADVRKDEPTFGYVRWHFPQNATVTFQMQKAPEHLVLHNPSTSPLKLNIAKVHIETGEVERDILLIRDSTVSVW